MRKIQIISLEEFVLKIMWPPEYDYRTDTCHVWFNFFSISDTVLNMIIYILSSIGPGGLPAPGVLACAMRSLAIVFTNFRSLFLRLLLLTHFGESPMCEIIFHPIFWHNEKIYAKKNYVILIFYGQRSVTAAWATRSPWSILQVIT